MLEDFAIDIGNISAFGEVIGTTPIVGKKAIGTETGWIIGSIEG